MTIQPLQTGPQMKFFIPSSYVGLVIGKQGAQIKILQQKSGCRVQVAKEDIRGQREITVIGQQYAAEQVKQDVMSIISQGEQRQQLGGAGQQSYGGGAGGGGYGQQQQGYGGYGGQQQQQYGGYQYGGGHQQAHQQQQQQPQQQQQAFAVGSEQYNYYMQHFSQQYGPEKALEYTQYYMYGGAAPGGGR